MEQLSTTPLNSVNQSKTWPRPCIETRHVTNLSLQVYTDLYLPVNSPVNQSAKFIYWSILTTCYRITRSTHIQSTVSYDKTPKPRVMWERCTVIESVWDEDEGNELCMVWEEDEGNELCSLAVLSVGRVRSHVARSRVLLVTGRIRRQAVHGCMGTGKEQRLTKLSINIIWLMGTSHQQRLTKSSISIWLHGYKSQTKVNKVA